MERKPSQLSGGAAPGDPGGSLAHTPGFYLTEPVLNKYNKSQQDNLCIMSIIQPDKFRIKIPLLELTEGDRKFS